MKKVVLLGETNTGKSSILSYFLKEKKYPENHYPTLGVEAGVKTINYDNDEYALVQFWDTAGKTTFHDEICTRYYEGTDGFIIVIDKSDKMALNSIPNWLNRIKKTMKNKKYIVGVIANKKDLEDPNHPHFSHTEFNRTYANEGIAMYEEVSLKYQKSQGNNKLAEDVITDFVKLLYEGQLLKDVPEYHMDGQENQPEQASNCTCNVM